jgi:TonB dependent receptor/TonB-dependent Receptor Plug Domain
MSQCSRIAVLAIYVCAFCSVLIDRAAYAAGVPGHDIDTVVVTGTRTTGLVGQADAASEGTVTSAQIENRPILRTAEVLEVVPGLVVTQHSGDGKANQYFLRGFNLDHGTDFASYVEGMPVNMPTHGHGQGYSDINFMIPELVDRIEYRKGTYYADEGDFSAAGAASITYKRALANTVVSTTVGEDQYVRAVLASSISAGGGDLLFGLDITHTDGPWVLEENLRKTNAVVKYTYGSADSGFDVAGMVYDAEWHSTDQIPLRAVESGQIDRFGYIDPTDGGNTHRYSLSANAWQSIGAGQIKALVYGIEYKLNLFSNFTYFIDAGHGDQFEQFDQRRVYGADMRYTQSLAVFGQAGNFTVGLQTRYDDISPVGLYLTEAREPYEIVRQDQVKQVSYSAFLSQATHWTEWIRSELGLRVDAYHFDVDSNLALNSGTADDSVVSPKLSLAFGPWDETEFFVNWGQGFHSNDARGTTIAVDPTDGVTPVDKVTPLVKAFGEEVGVRTAIVPDVQFAAALWTLNIDSELLFTGDGGTTEPSRASHRTGVELSAYYTPVEHLIIDADFSWSHAKFTDYDSAGDHIPNAVERVASLGITYNNDSSWFGGARLRYLGPAPLIEDNSVRSESTTLVNLDVGYHITQWIKASITLLNVFDTKANDITYYYESQLQNEASPVSDIHFHPVEPRTLRATITVRF